jgi:hypothetical protein
MSVICAGSLTSAFTLNVRRPSALQSSSTSFAWSMRLRSTIATSAPSDAIARAYAAPIPCAAPVTMQTLSSKRSPMETSSGPASSPLSLTQIGNPPKLGWWTSTRAAT